MIPKIIHYVWLGGAKKPASFEGYLQSWKKYCPDYEIREWNEENFDFSDSLYAMQSYAARKFGFTPDYIRAVVLEKYGGIYLDTDVEITKNFDDLLSEQFFTCFENDAYIETAILGSEPGHPFPKMMAEFYRHHPFNRPEGSAEAYDMMPSTPIWTYFLHQYYGLRLEAKLQRVTAADGSTVTVFPNEYFAPINFTTGKLKQTENTYAIHHFANSWAGRKEHFLHGLTVFAYYTFGKRIFGAMTRSYTKSAFRKIAKLPYAKQQKSE